MRAAVRMRPVRDRAPPASPSPPIEPSTLHGDVGAWNGLFRRLDIAPHSIFALSARASENGTGMISELAASGLVDEDRLYAAIAEECGMRYLPDVDARTIRAAPEEALALLRAPEGGRLVQAVGSGGEPVYLCAPEGPELGMFLQRMAARPTVARRVFIVSPSRLRQALIARARPATMAQGRDTLFLRTPHFSARMVANAWQGLMIGTLMVGIPAALAYRPEATMLALHAGFSVFFFACIVVRILATFARRTRKPPPRRRLDRTQLPPYSVVVALMNEAEVVPDLLASLGRLDWPRSKFEVKLVCESDDHSTLRAIRSQKLRPWVEIIEVPPGMPRSKPNALSYALPLLKGEIVAVYDAEDRPHPQQLIEAWRAFEAGDANLACVQAPIDIDNGDAGMIPRLFEVEYAALFHGLLPYLADRGLLLPLGGTSNHFRRAVLDHVAGWDPYNMTEDADLGTRLVRFGYRSDVITLPTGEDAPDTTMVWLKQRTRWLKGWGQTWLVHMRNPVRLAREVGPGSYAIVQVLFAGMLISALVHPLMLLTLIAIAGHFAVTGATTGPVGFLFWFDAANIALGYGAFLLLAWTALAPERRRGFWKVVAFTPVYWMLMSVAAWRAAYQLYVSPHIWEKTPHKRRWNKAKVAQPTGDRRNSGPSPMMAGSSSPSAASSRPS